MTHLPGNDPSQTMEEERTPRPATIIVPVRDHSALQPSHLMTMETQSAASHLAGLFPRRALPVLQRKTGSLEDLDDLQSDQMRVHRVIAIERVGAIDIAAGKIAGIAAIVAILGQYIHVARLQ